MVKKLVSWDEVLEALPPVVRGKLDSLYLLKAELNTRTTPAEVHAIFDADLAAWIGTAPGALDTLLEFANAIGNDPNFAATITAKFATMQTDINGKAPLVHTHVANDITDASAIGKSVLRSNTTTAARDAIGAGTSSLTIGTVAGTALEGHRLQVVASLPGSPTPNTWYGIPE